MIPLKAKGWMVNMTMRRVEYVEAEESPYNRPDYGRYRGPRRTYMLHAEQVHDTELHALMHLQNRMTARHKKLSDQLKKYAAELHSVAQAVREAIEVELK